MAASAAASVVWLTPDASVTLASGLLSDFGAALTPPALTATFVSFAALVAAWDSDFLFVTEAFGCTVGCFSAAFGNDFSDGFAAALEVDLTAGLAAVFCSGRETALDVVLFVVFVLGVPAPALGLAALFANAAAGPAALLAEAGLGVFAEIVGVFAVFFIAFAMEVHY